MRKVRVVLKSKFYQIISKQHNEFVAARVSHIKFVYPRGCQKPFFECNWLCISEICHTSFYPIIPVMIFAVTSLWNFCTLLATYNEHPVKESFPERMELSARKSVNGSVSSSDRDCCWSKHQRTTPSGRTTTVCEKQLVPTCPSTILIELFTGSSIFPYVVSENFPNWPLYVHQWLWDSSVSKQWGKRPAKGMCKAVSSNQRHFRFFNISNEVFAQLLSCCWGWNIQSLLRYWS